MESHCYSGGIGAVGASMVDLYTKASANAESLRKTRETTRGKRPTVKEINGQFKLGYPDTNPPQGGTPPRRSK